VSDGEGVERLLGAGQRTTEHVGGRDERRELWAHFLDLCKRRILPPFWLVLAVPLLVGPWILAVYVPLAVEQGAAHVADWLRLKDAPEPDRGSLAALGVLVAVVLLFLPDAAIIWLYPWQRSHAGWLGLRWPVRFAQWIPLMIALRFTLAYAVTRAWRIEEPHITNRQRREEELPTTSGIAFDTTAPHLVDIPGTHNPHRNPEAAPIVQVQPTRITPLRVAPNAHPIRTIELPFGGAVEVDRLVAMLEADEGFSWRTWRRHGWTRGEWETACQILVHSGIISEPQSGKTTARLVSVDAAVERIEDMG